MAVVDTGGSLLVGEAFAAALRARTDLPVRYVINTHFHPDHTLGNAAFEVGDTVFVGHRNLPRALAERGPHYLARMADIMGAAAEGSAIVLPTLLVEDRLLLDLGDRELELRAWSTAHTSADLTVLDRQTDTLIAGDLLFMQHLPVVDGSLNGWLDWHTHATEIDVDRVIPGHGPVIADWPQALAPQATYLEALRDSLRAEIARGVDLGTASETLPAANRNDWSLVDDYHPRNVITGYTELEWE